MPDVDLERFHDGYRRVYDRALAEINGGRKLSHWMWFIFPQVAGLGSSPTAAYYAIGDRAEAAAFFRDPVLGPGYRTLVDAVWRQVVEQGLTIRQLFGCPDDQKLISSLTLFTGIASQLGDDFAATVAKADEVLDQAETQDLGGAPPPDDSSPTMLDPDTAPLDERARFSGTAGSVPGPLLRAVTVRNLRQPRRIRHQRVTARRGLRMPVGPPPTRISPLTPVRSAIHLICMMRSGRGAPTIPKVPVRPTWRRPHTRVVWAQWSGPSPSRHSRGCVGWERTDSRCWRRGFDQQHTPSDVVVSAASWWQWRGSRRPSAARCSRSFWTR